MKAFQTTFQGEPLLLKVPSTESAEALAYYLCLPELRTPPAGGATERVLDLSHMAPFFEEAQEALPPLLLEAVHTLAVVLEDRFLFLHGCGFRFDEKAVLVFGPSGSGKTTLAMVADHLGYPALGEDLVIIEWKRRRVHGLAMPFRPRPFTRKLLGRWYRERGGSWEQDAPVRPRAASGSYPLDRAVLAGGHETTAPEALLACAFGRAGLDAASLVTRITEALSGCMVHRCPQVRIPPGISETRLKQIMEQWLNHPDTPCPKGIFGTVS